MPALQSILDRLACAQKELLRAADAVPVVQWETSPGNDRWTAGELTSHLISVERAILRAVDKLLQGPPKPYPWFKRFHLPMALVEARLIKRKSPITVDPRLVRGKEAMLAELLEVRERTLTFVEETRGRDLSEYCWRHPFLGTLNTYQWFQMIASHEIRHAKQMWEIAADLPKVVARLQK